MNSNAGANSRYDGIPTFKVGLPVILSNSAAQRVKWQATLQGTQTAVSQPSKHIKQAPQSPPAVQVSASQSEATLEKNEMQSRQATKSSSIERTPKSFGADRCRYTSNGFDEQTLHDEHAGDLMQDDSKDPYDVPMNYAYYSETLFDAYPDRSGALVNGYDAKGRYKNEDGYSVKGYGSTGGYMTDDGYGLNGSADRGYGHSGYRQNSYGTNGTAKNGFGFTSSQRGYESNPDLGYSSGYSEKNDASYDYGTHDASGSSGYGANAASFGVNDYDDDGYSSGGFSYSNDYSYASGSTSNGYRGTNDGKHGHIVPPGYETDSYMRYSGPSATDTRKPSSSHFAPAVYEASYPGSSQISMPLHSDLKSGDLQPSTRGKSKAKPKRRTKKKVGASKAGASTQPTWLPDVAIYDSGNGDALDYFSPISCEINERAMSRSCSYTRSDKGDGTTHGAFALQEA